jgi:hypothetical protein
MVAKRKDPFERVQNEARRRMSWRESRESNLYIQREVLRKGAVIEAQHQKIRLRQDTVMVFADDAPLYNWGHPCRYMLYEAENGELYQEVAARFHRAVVWPAEELLWPVIPALRFVLVVPKGDRYAVLFSGASNNRHVNDLEFLYRTLIDVYNFAADHIYVLNYDGSINYSGGPHPVGNWPGDNTPYRMPVNGRGTKSDLEGVFNDLKTRLHRDDLLLIHTNNHGGHDGTESYLCTSSGASYKASDFAAKLGELPKFRCLVAMLEQCHAGGFNSPIIAQSPATNTSVASACTEYAGSIGGASFDPFARDWIAAVNDADPYGAALAFDPDTDGSGKVSAWEAFHYADAVHHPYDTPVYDASPTAAGSCHLGQLWRWLCFPWRRLILSERLEHYLEVVPAPKLYEKVYKELVPRLTEFDEELEASSRDLEKEMGPRLEELIKEALG